MHPESAPSYETIARFFILYRYSRKMLERRHILRDEEEVSDYRELIAAVVVVQLLAVYECYFS